MPEHGPRLEECLREFAALSAMSIEDRRVLEHVVRTVETVRDEVRELREVVVNRVAEVQRAADKASDAAATANSRLDAWSGKLWAIVMAIGLELLGLLFALLRHGGSG